MKKQVLYLRVSPEARTWIKQKARAHKGKVPENVIVERLILNDMRKAKSERARRNKTA